MSRSYGIKRDFGLQGEGGVFLPETEEKIVAKETSSYRSTMPAYRHSGGRGQHGRLNISSGTPAASNKTATSGDAARNRNGKSPSSRAGEAREKTTKQPRSWFGRNPGGAPVVESVTVEGTTVTRASPMLHVRSSMRSGDRDQFGRPQAEPEGSTDEEVRMQLSYDAPVDITKTATDLVRLTLRPSGGELSDGGRKSDTTLQVTLRQRGQGFGLHLSTGLPPITVTYVEPGGDAEAAGVSVGDQVVEVNGVDSETVKDVTKIVALKSIIQQTHIREVSNGGTEGGEEEGVSGLTDTTWSKIQAKQHQDEVDSHTSSNVELKQIDDDSDTPEDVLEKFREKARKSAHQEQVQISATEWERMKEQRELLFDKNAPSAIIQEKGLRKDTATTQPPPSPTSPPGRNQQQQQQQSGDIAGATSPSEKQQGTPKRAKSSSSSWFKKRKRDGPSGSPRPGPVTEERGHGGKKSQSGKTGGKTPAAESKTSKGGGGLVMKVTSIDDIADDGDGVKEAKKKASSDMKKTFSYEGALLPPPDPGHMTNSLPRSRSHNAMFRNTLLQAVEQQQAQTQRDHTSVAAPSLDAPNRAHHRRSKSYEIEDEVGGVSTGGGGGGGEGWVVGALSQNDGYWDNTGLKVASRKASKSQTDVSRPRPGIIGPKVDIKPNLRLKKSGVVKGTSSWGQRPTLQVFGASETDRAKKEKGGVKVDPIETIDGPSILDELHTASNDSGKPVDLAAIPHTNPSLGRHSGHTRRDLVNRSSVKRRPPKNKSSLLFKVDDFQKMGTKRVDLSEYSSTPCSRTRTMPAKISREKIETTPVSTSLHLPMREHREDEDTNSYSTETSGGIRNIFKEIQQNGSDNGHRQPKSQARESIFTVQRQVSNTSTGSSAELVARAIATKKAAASEEAEGEEESEEGGRMSGPRGETAGSAILARLRKEKKDRDEVGKDGERGEKETDPDEGEKKKDEGEKVEEGGEGKTEMKDREKKEEEIKEKEKTEKAKAEKAQPNSALSLRRRKKTVEKPVKSLEIASEATPPHASRDHTPVLTKVNLRKTPSYGPKLESSSASSSTTPSWVAMAEKKKQRVSALLQRDPTSSVVPPPSPITSNTARPPTTSPTSHTTSTPTVATSSTSPPTPSLSPTKPTSPPTPSPSPTKPTASLSPTKPTSPPTASPSPNKPTSQPTPSLSPTKPTPPPTASPSPNKPTSQPTPSLSPTKPTSPPTASPSPNKPTSQPTPSLSPTKRTSPPTASPSSTKPTSQLPNTPSPSPAKHTTTPPTSSSSSSTKHTLPSSTNTNTKTTPSKKLTKLAKAFPSTPPPTPTTTATKATTPASVESGIPRKGTVRDRMALFQ